MNKEVKGEEEDVDETYETYKRNDETFKRRIKRLCTLKKWIWGLKKK